MMSNIKVLHLLPHLDIGGITTYAYTLSKYLLRRGVEVAVASSGGGWEEEFRRLGITTYPIDIKTKSELSPKVVKAFFSLDTIRSAFAFNIIHSHTRVTQVIAELYRRTRGCVHIANFHGFYRQHKRRLGRKLFKAQGTMSIAITPQVKEVLVKAFGADPSRVEVILSAIDLERLDSDAGALTLQGNPRIGSAGRLSSIKGFRYLIEGFSRIHKKLPQAHLYILGEGKEEDNLRALARRLNVENRFSVVKNINLARFLKALDIFCYPSLEEPLGLSVLEAQYLGVPCVVTDTGGLRILVEHERTGLRVPRADSSSLAGAITRLIADPALSRTLGGNGRRQVIDKFDLSKRVDAFIKVYEKALARRD